MDIKELRKRMKEMGVDVDAMTDDAVRTLVDTQREAATASRVEAGDTFKPKSIDEAKRTVRSVIATEGRVKVADWNRMEMVEEVLLASGMRVRETDGVVPLLDTHSRYSIDNVLGSCRDIAAVGDVIECTEEYSTVARAQEAFTKVKEGHVRRRSVGYRRLAKFYVEPGKTEKINGREWTAGKMPLAIVTEWELAENSLCAIGADVGAGSRSIPQSQPSGKPGKQREEGEESMNKYLKKFLFSRGLPKTATDDEARALCAEKFPNLAALVERKATDDEIEDAVLAEGARAQQPAPVNSREEGIRMERDRQSGIRNLCKGMNLADDVAQRYINDGLTIEQANERAVQAAIGQLQSTPRVTVVQDAGDSLRNAMADGLALRMGFNVEKPAAGAEELRGFTLIESCREFLRKSGMNHRGTNDEIAKRALTTSDFANLFTSGVSRELTRVEAESLADESYMEITDESGIVTDFRSKEIVRVSQVDGMLETGEAEETKFGSFKDGKETVSAKKYTRGFGITDEMIINDDLGAISEIPAKIMNAVARLKGDLAWSPFLTNPNMGDGTALFHADHRNLAGTATAIGDTGIEAAVTAMRDQRDLNGIRLNVRPQFLIVAAANELTARKFVGTAFLDYNAGKPNVLTFLKVVADARLNDLVHTTNKYPWFLQGRKGTGVKLFFLNGKKVPTIETGRNIKTGQTEIVATLVVGAKAMSWVNMYKNAGA